MEAILTNSPDFLYESICFGLFAAVGGCLAYTLRCLNQEKKPKVSRAIAEFLASGFVGILAMLGCKAMELDWRWSGLVVGVFGWLGAEVSIALLAKLVRKKLGISDNDTSSGS